MTRRDSSIITSMLIVGFSLLMVHKIIRTMNRWTLSLFFVLLLFLWTRKMKIMMNYRNVVSSTWSEAKWKTFFFVFLFCCFQFFLINWAAIALDFSVRGNSPTETIIREKTKIENFTNNSKRRGTKKKQFLKM